VTERVDDAAPDPSEDPFGGGEGVGVEVVEGRTTVEGPRAVVLVVVGVGGM